MAPKSVTELLEMYNATKHLQLLIDSGYDDINYICETRDEELKDIGIVSRADREQVNKCMKYWQHMISYD